jgi:hypothetical protein
VGSFSFAMMVLRKCTCAAATPQGQVDTDIAHRHFGPGECAEYHQIVEIRLVLTLRILHLNAEPPRYFAPEW